jgi:hypothetical protein
MNMAICVRDCQFSAGNMIVTYNAVLADGRTFGAGALVPPSATGVLINQAIINDAKQRALDTFAVTVGPADIVRVFGGVTV